MAVFFPSSMLRLAEKLLKMPREKCNEEYNKQETHKQETQKRLMRRIIQQVWQARKMSKQKKFPQQHEHCKKLRK